LAPADKASLGEDALEKLPADIRRTMTEGAVREAIDNAGVTCAVHSSCSICGQPGVIVHSELRDLIFGVPGTWGLRRCSNERCALMWLDPMPLPDETKKFYANYYTHVAGEGGAAAVSPPRTGWKSLLKRALARILFWRKHSFLSGLSYLEGLTPGKMLEVGCGNGQLLRQATAAGWRAVGIDFDAVAIAAVRTIANAEAFVGDLVSMKFGDGEFDAIVMNNVIEHLPMPDGVLRECRRILRPGGRLVLVTPNLWSLGYKEYGQDWRGLEVPRHLYLYSPATLAALAKAAKFARWSAFSSAGGGTGVEMLLFSQALRDKRLGRDATKDERRARRTINEEIRSILFGRDVGEWAVLVAHK
jgi:2-polyprenyl-3-methyl-5-hydroxy-6-metoxy-1,4-benzoquinol methylase